MTRRDLVIAEALDWRGTPYHHQASLKGVGCDCLGLLRGVWREVMGSEPERAPAYTRDWAEAHGRETLAEAARRHLVPVLVADIAPGDVLLFALTPAAPAKHCAILTALSPDGSGRMVHAIETHPVAEVSLAPWWRRRLRYAFAFPES